MTAVDRHVVDHGLAFRDDVMVIDGELVTEIVDDHRDDLIPALSALFLRTCCVVHQIFGDQFVADLVATGRDSTE